jgi:hypothetical protein
MEEGVRWRASVKVGGFASDNEVSDKGGSNMDKLFFSRRFSDLFCEIGSDELDDCPELPDSSWLFSSLLEKDEHRFNDVVRSRVCTRTSGVCVPG